MFGSDSEFFLRFEDFLDRYIEAVSVGSYRSVWEGFCSRKFLASQFIMRLTSLLLSRSLPGGNRSLAEAIASAKASVGRHHRETTPSGTPLLPGVDLVERIRRSKINYSQHQVWRTQRKNDLIEAIRKTQLKPVKRITFKFDPFHPQATSCREYLFLISNEEIRETNPDCALRTEVVDTRDDPTITVELGE